MFLGASRYFYHRYQANELLLCAQQDDEDEGAQAGVTEVAGRDYKAAIPKNGITRRPNKGQLSLRVGSTYGIAQLPAEFENDTSFTDSDEEVDPDNYVVDETKNESKYPVPPSSPGHYSVLCPLCHTINLVDRRAFWLKEVECWDCNKRWGSTMNVFLVNQRRALFQTLESKDVGRVAISPLRMLDGQIRFLAPTFVLIH